MRGRETSSKVVNGRLRVRKASLRIKEDRERNRAKINLQKFDDGRASFGKVGKC
jgi:hypothetical protein